MISEDRLIAWLVMADFQFCAGNEVSIPEPAVDALQARGWLETLEPGERGEEHSLGLSDRGRALADLWGPDFGVELCFEPEASE